MVKVPLFGETAPSRGDAAELQRMASDMLLQLGTAVQYYQGPMYRVYPDEARAVDGGVAATGKPEVARANLATKVVELTNSSPEAKIVAADTAAAPAVATPAMVSLTPVEDQSNHQATDQADLVRKAMAATDAAYGINNGTKEA